MLKEISFLKAKICNGDQLETEIFSEKLAVKASARTNDAKINQKKHWKISSGIHLVDNTVCKMMFSL